MSAEPDFTRLVQSARRTVPGGRFLKEDRHGLSRRAKALGIEAATCKRIIDEVQLQARPRHPVTRGIE